MVDAKTPTACISVFLAFHYFVVFESDAVIWAGAVEAAALVGGVGLDLHLRDGEPAITDRILNDVALE